MNALVIISRQAHHVITCASSVQFFHRGVFCLVTTNAATMIQSSHHNPAFDSMRDTKRRTTAAVARMMSTTLTAMILGASVALISRPGVSGVRSGSKPAVSAMTTMVVEV